MVRDWNTLDDLDIRGKYVLTRVDLNVPMLGERVADDTRIRRISHTVTDILARGGTPVLMSHFGRPGGKIVEEFSLRKLVPTVEHILRARIHFVSEILDERNPDLIDRFARKIVLLENLRFHHGETTNDPNFCRKLAQWGQIYCNDAFSASHRNHASISGVAALMPCCAGRSLNSELESLALALKSPRKPVAAIIGGSKISTKIGVLHNLLRKVDILVIGGAMANTFILANGYKVGRSLVEPEQTNLANKIVLEAEKHGCRLLLPTDVTVAAELVEGTKTHIVPADKCPQDHMILDVGPAAVRNIKLHLRKCKTILWNGPVGAFEISPFDISTTEISIEIARLTKKEGVMSVVGGGDTLYALSKAGVRDDISYISTGGGAFIEYIEGKELPGISALSRRDKGVATADA